MNEKVVVLVVVEVIPSAKYNRKRNEVQSKTKQNKSKNVVYSPKELKLKLKSMTSTTKSKSNTIQRSPSRFE